MPQQNIAMLLFINSLVRSSYSDISDVSPESKDLSTSDSQNTGNDSSVPPIVTHSLWVHFPLIIALNILVLSAVYYVKELHTPSNMIIGSLSITDLLTGFWTLPVVWMISNPDPEINNVIQDTKTACLFFRLFGSYLFPGLSLKYIFLTSLERFFAIMFPIKHRVLSNLKNMAILIAVIFVVDVLILVVVVLFYLHQDIWKDGLSNAEIAEQCKPNKIYPKSLTVFKKGLMITLVITSLCMNLVVGYFAWKQINARFKPYSSLTSHEFKKRHTQLYNEIKLKENQLTQLKISLTLMCIYAILYSIPLIIAGSLRKYTTNMKMVRIFLAFGRHCLIANAWINAIVYPVLKKTYRRAYFFFLTNSPWKWSEVNASLNRSATMSTQSNTTKVTKGTQNSMNVSSSTKNTRKSVLAASRQSNNNQQLEQEYSEKKGGDSNKRKSENSLKKGNSSLSVHSRGSVIRSDTDQERKKSSTF